MNAGWGLWPRISWNPPDFTWNPVNFTQISPVKSTQNYKSKCFSKTSSVWWMQGGEFHPINPVDFTQIHLWNPPKIIKASVSAKTSVWWMQGRGYDQGFHEIHQISPWNPVDFTQISPVRSTQNYKSKCFSKNSLVWWMQGGGYDQGFHEICWISREIRMKSAGFHELWAFVWWSSIGLSTFERPIIEHRG